MKYLKYLSFALIAVFWSSSAHAGSVAGLGSLKAVENQVSPIAGDKVVKVRRWRRRGRRALGAAIGITAGAIILNHALRNHRSRRYYSYRPRRRLSCRQLRRRCIRWDSRRACRIYNRRCW